MIRVVTMALIAAGLLLGAPSRAVAQMSLGPISGVLTGHIGTATGGDGAGTTLSAGASVAVVEESGWGVELDAGFANDDSGRTGGLSMQSYILNVLAVWPRGQLRPFVAAGAGALRATRCTTACPNTTTWTDFALSAGGGLQYLFNETWGLRGEVRYISTVSDHPDPPRSSGIGLWRVAVGGTFLWSAQ